MTDIAKIAEGLTEAQREVVLAAWEFPDYHRNGPQVSYCPVAVNGRNSAAMDRKGITASKAEGGPRLTPLGLALRAHLERER